MAIGYNRMQLDAIGLGWKGRGWLGWAELEGSVEVSYGVSSAEWTSDTAVSGAGTPLD
jgi:hypothetical protein